VQRLRGHFSASGKTITTAVRPGIDVMILKIFSPKNLAKILAFFAQTTASFCKNMIITLVFEKNANFLAENWQNRRQL
jgi:hypothetical protein